MATHCIPSNTKLRPFCGCPLMRTSLTFRYFWPSRPGRGGCPGSPAFWVGRSSQRKKTGRRPLHGRPLFAFRGKRHRDSIRRTGEAAIAETGLRRGEDCHHAHPFAAAGSRSSIGWLRSTPALPPTRPAAAETTDRGRKRRGSSEIPVDNLISKHHNMIYERDQGSRAVYFFRA